MNRRDALRHRLQQCSLPGGTVECCCWLWERMTNTTTHVGKLEGHSSAVVVGSPVHEAFPDGVHRSQLIVQSILTQALHQEFPIVGQHIATHERGLQSIP